MAPRHLTVAPRLGQAVTILTTITPDDAEAEKLTIERDYEAETTTVTIDYYGDPRMIILPTPELMRFLTACGLR